MAYSTVPKSTDYFNTKLWTGNSTNSTAITGVGFQPDMVWIKNRSTTDNHAIFDAIRGATYRIYPNNTDAQIQATNSLASFDSDGFTLNDGGDANGNGENIVGWNWKANGAGSSNTDGTINTIATSANTTSGFSISKYAGNGSSGATFGHGIGKTVKMVIVKDLTGTYAWKVWHYAMTAGKTIVLNTNDPEDTDTNRIASANSTTVTTSGTFAVNQSGRDYIAYCFADVQGFSKAGSYTGNGNADGPMIYTGFKPAWILLKRFDSGTLDWNMYDSKRLGYNGGDAPLFANLNNAESNDYGRIDFLSNGFKIRSSNDQVNNNGGSFLYMAFGQPIVSTNGNIATAR